MARELSKIINNWVPEESKVIDFGISTKVSNAYFSIAILTYATLTLVLHMLNL